MRVCLMIEGQEDVTWDDWRALAGACEEHGVEALFRSDHYLSVEGRAERGSLDAWATIAALAAVTSKVRLGTLVSPVTFRHPSQLAKVVVTADHVSGGRVELGLGTGWLEAEHETYGFPYPPLAERMAMLAEQLELISRQWAPGPSSFDGRHYRVRELDALPKPLQRPRPNLILGGSARPRSLRLAARHADEYNTPARAAEECRTVRRNLDEACRREGRDPIPLSVMTNWSRIGGTPDAAIERLRELAAAGVERVMLQHLQHRDLDAVEQIGRQVAPALR
jgi:F420-dependent oxidoreductase-like protein